MPSSNRPHFVQNQNSAPASSTPLLGQGRRRQSPFERRPDVLLLDPQPPETRQLTVVAEDGQYPTELVEEELEMPLAQPIGGAGLDEPFARVLADRLEEAVPALAGALAVHYHE